MQQDVDVLVDLLFRLHDSSGSSSGTHVDIVFDGAENGKMLFVFLLEVFKKCLEKVMIPRDLRLENVQESDVEMVRDRMAIIGVEPVVHVSRHQITGVNGTNGPAIAESRSDLHFSEYSFTVADGCAGIMYRVSFKERRFIGQFHACRQIAPTLLFNRK